VEKNVRQSGISVKAWRNAVQTFAAALDAAPLFVDGALQAHRAAADLSAMIAQLEAVVCQRGINRLRRTTSGGGLLPFDWPDPAAQGFVSKTEGEEACSVCGQPANVTTKCHRLLPIKRTVSCCASCGAASETPHWGRPLHIDAPTRALAGELVQVTVRAAAPDQQNCAGTIRIDLSGAAGSLWSAEPAMVRAVRAAGCDAGNQFGLTLSPRLISGLYLLRAWAIIDLDMFVAIRPFRIMASGQCPCDR